MNMSGLTGALLVGSNQLLGSRAILGKGQGPSKYRLGTKIVFDAQQLIVFCSPFGSARRTSFDLTGS